MKRRFGIAAVVAALAVALTACTGLPMSGPVVQGLPAGQNAGDAAFAFLPDGPQRGATPQQIVDGFLKAGSGPQGGWETARLFLASSFRDTWKPTAGVTVDDLSARSYSPDGADNDKRASIDLQVSPVASVDANGGYTVVSSTKPTPLSFSLARQSDGEWRITKARDGIVLDQTTFASVFHPYSLMYYDTSWTYLVPDVRWFPATNAASRIVQALVKQKPSAWLMDSVRSAFPENVGVSASVPQTAGVAQVDVTGIDTQQIQQTTLNRMLTQLTASLATAGITSVKMLSGSTPVDATVLAPPSAPPPQTVLLTDKGFGLYQSEGQIDPLPGLDGAVAQQHPNAIELSADRQTAALRLDDGTVGMLSTGRPMAAIDARPGLVGPTLDPRGFVWTVPAAAPTAVRAVNDAGKGGAIAGAWSGASRIEAMRVSHDGARIAAIVVVGGRPLLEVAGIIRDPDTLVPQRLSDPVVIGTLPGDGLNLDWLDDTTVGALAHDGDSITLVAQQVGGTAQSIDAPPGAVSLAGLTTVETVRLRGADGALYLQRGSTWSPVGSGVRVLATVQ
ncbi:LpqB family beta-propeller domain-containing protein [Microbacterium sp. ASV49]|uniref:LpqB family beta-propeller domain-containing protein n=1 Tax=Microbacterium candidum TaxID=3041922 RepID=A0ABT7N0Y6_9MICO|nr:LpqB family beta-propeller domain-containing protein [Microbacterium sp. ASV49]MDL9980357.1 LpqB family beta-propeller domain-containing protein [Microbacterium sp. ASV49]